MAIAELLVQSTEVEVEAGGLRWKVRAIDNVAFVECGFGVLAAVADKRAPKADEAAPEGLSPQRMKEVRALAVRRQRMVIAGTVAVARPGGDWEPIHLVEAGKPEDPTQNRMAVTRLPPVVFAVLADTISSLSSKEGLASTRLLSFLGGT